MNIKIKKRNGRLEDFDVSKINANALRACEGIKDVSASEIVLDAQLQLYDKITTVEIDKSLILSAREKIEKEPDYSYAAAGLVLNTLYKEVFREGVDSDCMELQYRKSFIQNIKSLVEEGRLDRKLLSFDLKKLSESLNLERDKKFKYLGIQILFDRYLLRSEGKIMEAPQSFWMRVAMGLSINEKNKDEWAIRFYNLISSLKYTPSTPTLFNSGTCHSQLSSCYLNTFDDSIDGIFDGAWQEARKSKYAGGLGLDVTPFRASGSLIKGTNGRSSGLVPWLKIYNDVLVAVNQGGKRPGAGCAYLEPWHLDFPAFLSERSEWKPRFEVLNGADAYRLRADLPGMIKKDVDIKITEDVLTIKGERENKNINQNDYSECTYGKFSRSFSLPDDVKQDDIKASMKDGVLAIEIPRMKKVSPEIKKISIK